MNTEQTKNIISYLLGELPDNERDKIEDRLFTDEDFADLVDETETDLIDEYVRGELETTQVTRFEQFFQLSEGRREKVKLAQILNKELFEIQTAATINKSSEKVSFWESVTAFFRLPALNFAAVALVLLAILVGGFLLFRSPQNNQIARGNENTVITPIPSPVISPEISNSENTNAPQNISVSNSNTNEPNRNRPSKTEPKNTNTTPLPTPPVKDENKQITAPQPIFAAILLTPLTRSDQSPILKIPANVRLARLQILNSDQNVYEKLRLDVVNSNGGLVLRREFDGKSKPKILTINIPAEKLANLEEYEITLSGATADKNFKDLNYYRFSVQKK